MKALVGAFNQEKALVGAFSVIVQPVVEPMDRFTALNIILQRRHHLHQCRCDSLESYCPGGAVSGANAFLCAEWMLSIDKYNFRTVQSFWYPGCFRSLSPSYLKLRFSFISWLKERLVSIVVSATFYTLDKTFRLTKWNRYLVISVSLQECWNWLCKLRLLWSLDGLVSLLGKYPSFLNI